MDEMAKTDGCHPIPERSPGCLDNVGGVREASLRDWASILTAEEGFFLVEKANELAAEGDEGGTTEQETEAVGRMLVARGRFNADERTRGKLQSLIGSLRPRRWDV